MNTYDELMVGLDVGSTTVKAVVMDPRTDEVLWKDYERHNTRQPEMCLEFLNRIEKDFPVPHDKLRIFITGSGGTMVGKHIGAKFVQEVNAVCLASEKLFPDVGSVIELGGQDAKIIIWFTDPKTGVKRKVPSMNDKCAGGTGAVIDKINAKLQIPVEELKELAYYDVKLHPVAGKCGVFAETDINGLQKNGVPGDQLMASLFEAIVQQNLSVLTRGNTLRPTVLLLGGPNSFIQGMQDCWKANIPKIWEERNFELPEGVDPADLVIVPDNAVYYAAIGSVLYGKSEDADVGVYTGSEELEKYVEVGRAEMREASGDVGLSRTPEELEEFKKLFAKEPWEAATFSAGEEVEAFIGIDGGSTSTKAVLMDKDGLLLATAYQLSKGNPLEDSKDILSELEAHVEDQGATLKVMGVGTTGYAKDMLKETLGADVGIVETVAHTKSALHYYKDADVIVDVGGQDIKVIVLKNGKVKDFKLNTQCSAGNGYFLQSTAAKFGYSVTEFADAAFEAERLPVFGYGCAVFMETDIVNFQQLGWEKKEIMAGLAKVLPKNIWLYVVAEPNLGKFGTNFVLQGGTQHNLAAVKSQYDFIRSKVPNSKIRVHQFTGESGAIGAALEAIRVAAERDSSFIGIGAAETLEFTATRDESTRCSFCKNKCLRTYIDTKTPEGKSSRFIIATCEKGTVEKVDDMRLIKAQLEEVMNANPNFVEKAATEAFKGFSPPRVSTLRQESEQEADAGSNGFFKLPSLRKPKPAAPLLSPEIKKLRGDIKIGMPKVLNMYSLAPLFATYFEALGINFQRITYSDETNPEMWYKGSRRGSIDQCLPQQVAIAHIHNLIFDQKPKKKPDVIFFPIIQHLSPDLVNSVGSAACPTVSITPDVVRAAFTKEGDVFAEHNMQYLAPSLDMTDRRLFEYEMYQCFKDVLGVTEEENAEAIEIAYESWQEFFDVTLRSEARKVLDQLEEDGKVGVVMLARPYHNDPGLNHEIMQEIQKKGYPIFSIDSLPQDDDILERLFGDEVREGVITHPKDISDVWKNSYSENSSKKVWGAKYTARHPNLMAIDLSSFKCGHDAPIYNTVEHIIESSGTPYFTFHDIDESKPTGSIKIRVETIDYFLQRYQEHLGRQKNSEGELDQMVDAYRAQLERQAAKAAMKLELEAAGSVGISGNNSVSNGNGHNHAGEAEDHEHASDAWEPITLNFGEGSSNGNGSGNGHDAPAVSAEALRLDGHQPNGNGNGHQANTGTYDQIRAANTAGEEPEDDEASASESCNLPGKDSPLKAFAQLRQLKGEPSPEEEELFEHNGKLVQPLQVKPQMGQAGKNGKQEKVETATPGDS